MKTNHNQTLAGMLRCLLLGALMLFTHSVMAQTLPYEITNNSEYADSEVYVAIVGITGGHVWVDPVTGQVNPMSQSDNTVQGPVYGGNYGPGENGLYANCFRRLSDIPNNTVNIPKIAGCRIMISFQSQLFLYFFGYDGDPQGYAAPNLQNETDPNQGIKFELVELTYNDFGLWCNTSRVDSYQYPMGLEVWGTDFYKKVGELKTHQQILQDWQNQAPSEFQSLYDPQDGMIHFPTKTSAFPTNFLQGYIDAIWNKYSTDELVFNSGQAGVWRGRVQGSQFVFTRDGDGQVAIIPGKPTTLEAMEGSGVLATGGQWDLVVQAQFVAAITRHAIDLNAPSGTYQDFGDISRYYQTWPYNWYAKFLHQNSISYDGLTYAFAYDDVFDRSATIHTPNPNNIKITVGGFAGLGSGGGGNYTQWQCHNFPNSYIRHASSGRARINSNVSPVADKEWNMVPGLAGAGVSFESRNQPGRYLRHRGGEIWLDANNGSGLFAADATWYPRAGLADGNKVSFESYNFPGRYIRHRGGLLYNESVSGSVGFADATFAQIGGSLPGGGFSQQIEAENFALQSGQMQTEACSEGGQNVGYLVNDGWLVYDVNLPASGTYRVEYRVASPNTGGIVQLEQAGGSTVFGQVNVPNTGGWQNWTTVSHTVNLNAGQQQLAIKTPVAGYNINWLRISSTGGARTAPTALGDDLNTNELVIFPNPASQYLSIKSAQEASAYAIYDMRGTEVRSGTLHPQTTTQVDVSGLHPGTYMVRELQSGKTLKFIKR
ncbi:beta-1,3-glucanase family protein [Roseivirga sp. BDSF3-8]|uniref:beta-1,3-glucanase family protein n=1 Tax=Roseivirga sp. BDSF3-8 TaxID=3241598 RepID=UPI003531FDBA